jgi:hypothetical protein
VMLQKAAFVLLSTFSISCSEIPRHNIASTLSLLLLLLHNQEVKAAAEARMLVFFLDGGECRQVEFLIPKSVLTQWETSRKKGGVAGQL